MHSPVSGTRAVACTAPSTSFPLLPVTPDHLSTLAFFAGTALSPKISPRSFVSRNSPVTVSPPRSGDAVNRSSARRYLNLSPTLTPDQRIPRCTPQHRLSLVPRTADHTRKKEKAPVVAYRDAARSSRNRFRFGSPLGEGSL